MEKFFIILIIALLALGVFSWFASRLHWFDHPAEKPDGADSPSDLLLGLDDEGALQMEKPHDSSTECCGLHAVCEKDRSRLSKDIVYYDDEELDAFRGISAETYDDATLELFSEIFRTLRPEDMLGWLNSLRMREIELPLELRDEAMMIVSEQA